MIKYEINKDSFEVVFHRTRHSSGIFSVDADYICNYCNPFSCGGELIGSYDSLEEALKEFNAIKVIECHLESIGCANNKGVTGHYYELQRNEYDEDGEFDLGEIVEIKSDYYNAESEEG